MKLQQIRETWVGHANTDSRQMWDRVSAYYGEKPLPQWETDEFLKLVAGTVDFSADMTAFDIGCGAGGYTFALAARVNKAVGMDFSPNMIRFAREKAKACKAGKAQFICGDWAGLDIEKEKLAKQFDIVFAHRTPAINSAAALEKMIGCAKKYCFLTKPTRRKDSVFDQIKKMLHLSGSPNSFDENIGCAFDLVWQLGGSPQFSYHDEQWRFEKTLAEACEWYTGRVAAEQAISEQDETKIKEYLQSVTVDGRVRETTTTTIVTMYWQV